MLKKRLRLAYVPGNIGEEKILNTLKRLIHHYANKQNKGECLGDFVIRAGYVKAVSPGTNFQISESISFGYYTSLIFLRKAPSTS